MEDVIEKQDGALEKTETQTESKQESKTNLEERLKGLEADVAKYKRIAERNARKAERSEDGETSESSSQKESTDLDNGQKALLRAMGIKGADELQLAKDFMKRTGLDIDSLESDDIFQARLEKLRTTKSNELASEATNRGNTSGGKDSADYWLAKLGPNDPVPSDLSRELREKIVEARRAKGKSSKMFYND